VVVRIGKDGSFKNSRPCHHCIKTMINYNIKNVIYSDEKGNIVIQKPQEINVFHISSGWNAYENKLT